MHRALLLPEIVAVIVKSETSEKGYLHTCLFINRLFFMEACRILWYECSSVWLSVDPEIAQLADISQRSRPRAQVYANFINILNITNRANTWPYRTEAELHSHLACLQYPRLQEVSFYEAGWFKRGDSVIRYAKPTLREFKLDGGSELSDAFFKELSARCPNLQNLTLSSTSNTFTRDGLSRFLRTSVSLKSLTLKEGFQYFWTREAFRAIGQFPYLEQLTTCSIQDYWIQEEETKCVFPDLKHLRVGISTSALDLLSRHAPKLTTLDITLPSPCTSIETLAKYPRLIKLDVVFDNGGGFSGADLLLIAENCPDLQELSVGSYGAPYPEVDGLDNLMMENIARLLRNIKVLRLHSINTGAKPLTLQSIKSLGCHCPNLKRLTLSSITADWNDIDGGNEAGAISGSICDMALSLHDTQPRLWPNNDNEENDEEYADSYMRIVRLAERFARQFPNMRSFDLCNGAEGEIHFNNAMSNFLWKRM